MEIESLLILSSFIGISYALFIQFCVVDLDLYELYVHNIVQLIFDMSVFQRFIILDNVSRYFDIRCAILSLAKILNVH